MPVRIDPVYGPSPEDEAWAQTMRDVQVRAARLLLREIEGIDDDDDEESISMSDWRELWRCDNAGCGNVNDVNATYCGKCNTHYKDTYRTTLYRHTCGNIEGKNASVCSRCGTP